MRAFNGIHIQPKPASAELGRVAGACHGASICNRGTAVVKFVGAVYVGAMFSR